MLTELHVDLAHFLRIYAYHFTVKGNKAVHLVAAVSHLDATIVDMTGGISNKLHISRNTVAFHIKNIYKKLEVPNAPAALSKAYRSGLLNPRNR